MSDDVQALQDMMVEYQAANAGMDATPDVIQALRDEGRAAYEQGWYTGEPFSFYSDQVEIEQYDRPCEGRRCRSEIWYYTHTPNDRSDCGLILYHGGGGVFGSAPEAFHYANRYAVDTGCVVFNTEYRLAPEYNIDDGNSGLFDAYDLAIHITDQIRDYNRWDINPARVAYLGESGGGWIAGGVGLQLAQNNESHRFAFQVLQIPQTGNMYVMDHPDEFYNEFELPQKHFFG